MWKKINVHYWLCDICSTQNIGKIGKKTVKCEDGCIDTLINEKLTLCSDCSDAGACAMCGGAFACQMMDVCEGEELQFLKYQN